MRIAGTALMALLLGGAPALASDITGTWQREDGASRVRIAPCGGDAVCGHVTWLRDPGKTPAKVGQRVFYDMKPDGDAWKGSAFNPEDGKTYVGKASMSGGTLTTKGCALAGLICKSYSWSRVN
ncbi:MAG: DUF2147 domain-containing protein [Hyphomicrobiales bacterium]|nr:DUF2147 domain-containing protein [Hyphomicrobiales bacterium]